MKITKTYNWNRRDFCFDSECEHCGHKETDAPKTVVVPKYDSHVVM